MSRQLTSRPLKERLTKVPSWFRPKNAYQATMAQNALRGMQRQEEVKERGLATMRQRITPKVAEIVRQYDVRSKDFLGGSLTPWTSDSWKRIQSSQFKSQHPIRHIVWQLTGLFGPA